MIDQHRTDIDELAARREGYFLGLREAAEEAKRMGWPGVATAIAMLLSNFLPHLDVRPVLLRSKPGPNDPHLRMVLCWLPENTHTPFVTWFENLQDSAREGRPCYYEGHYFLPSELAKAA